MKFPNLPQKETWFLRLLLQWINTTRRKQPAKLSTRTWIMSLLRLSPGRVYSAHVDNDEITKTICSFAHPTILSVSQIKLVMNVKAYKEGSTNYFWKYKSYHIIIKINKVSKKMHLAIRQCQRVQSDDEKKLVSQ